MDPVAPTDVRIAAGRMQDEVADAACWRATDGTEVTIRPIARSDLGLEQQFVDGLSRLTAYRRLLSARRLSHEELRRFTDIDPDREYALIATVRDSGGIRQIGVARYVKGPDSEAAEFAIVLADDWQGRGLGSRLLSSLVAGAKRRGVQRLVGTTLSENVAMLSLARRLGFVATAGSSSASITDLALHLGGGAGETDR
jgi:acetyltransferase